MGVITIITMANMIRFQRPSRGWGGADRNSQRQHRPHRRRFQLEFWWLGLKEHPRIFARKHHRNNFSQGLRRNNHGTLYRVLCKCTAFRPHLPSEQSPKKPKTGHRALVTSYFWTTYLSLTASNTAHPPQSLESIVEKRALWNHWAWVCTYQPRGLGRPITPPNLSQLWPLD